MKLINTPAGCRLEWLLAGLDGVEGWGADAEEVMAPEFLAAVPADDYVERTRRRSGLYAPLEILGVDIQEHVARARIRTRARDIYVAGCTVEPESLHRISNAWVTAEVPAFLGPRLPMDFPGHNHEPAGSGPLLVVFSGVPGTGKTTLADAVARKLRIPAFSGDWLLGALSPFGGYHLNNLTGISDELLTTLAFRQLRLDQSVVLDSPAEDTSTRDRWRSLAQSQGARLRVIVCVCSDASVHRSRAEGRRRQIPGWHDAAEWPDIERRLSTFQPWEAEALTVDSVCSLEQNLAAALDHLSGP